MPNTEGDPAYLEPYRNAVRTHGASFEATLWHSREKQLERFAVIAETTDCTDRVILDAGCGLGDFAAFLDTCEIRYKRYIGLEALPEMVEQARARHLPDAEFHVADFAADPALFARYAPDIITFSGSLNTFERDPLLSVIDHAFDAAAEAVVFNVLSSRNDKAPQEPGDPAIRHDPLALLEHALQRTPGVAFRQEYMDGHDATIGMWKSEKPGV